MRIKRTPHQLYAGRTTAPRRRINQSLSAFTRVELIAALAAIALLLAVIIAPALATTNSDSERLVCFNNLRMIGRAVQMWAGDYGPQTPWLTLVSDGGTMPTSGVKPGAAWFEYAFLSNELATPKILACPSDVGVFRAPDFVTFLTNGYRDNALSYVVGLHAVGDTPRSWLSGDRNLQPDPGLSSCLANVNNAAQIFQRSPTSPLAWTNGAVHGEFGHVLLTDGSVEFAPTPRLRALLLSPQADDNGATHFLKAR